MVGWNWNVYRMEYVWFIGWGDYCLLEYIFYCFVLVEFFLVCRLGCGRGWEGVFRDGEFEDIKVKVVSYFLVEY